MAGLNFLELLGQIFTNNSKYYSGRGDKNESVKFAVCRTAFEHSCFSKNPALYESLLDLSLKDLVIGINGYKVFTIDAIRGWMLVNEATDRVFEIRDYFIKKRVREEVPL